MSGEHISVLLAERRCVTADGAEVPGPLQRAPRTGDLLLGALSVEADQQVEGLLLVTRPLADLGSRVEAAPLGHQLSIANPDRVQRCGIKVVASVDPGIFDGSLRLDE